MALSVKVLEFAAPTATGVSADITGVGFQGKAAIFLITERTSDGSAVDAQSHVGFAVSSSDRRMVHAVGEDGGNREWVQMQNTRCIYLSDSNLFNDALLVADFDSWTADGFKLNVITTNGTAWRVIAIIFGGADLTNVATYEDTIKTTTGTKDIATGIGFKPDVVLNVAIELSTVATLNGSGVDRYMLGWATGSGQGLCALLNRGGGDLPDAKSYQVTTKMAGQISTASVLWEAAFSAFISNGVTMNFTTVNGIAYYFYGLAMKGGQWESVSDTQKTSTGTKATTTTRLPTGIVLTSINQTTSSSVQANARESAGAANSSSSRACRWTGTLDSGATKTADQDHDSASCIKMMTEGTPTTEAEADLSSFNPTDFTLNWVTADGTAREFLALVASSNPAASPSTVDKVFVVL